MGESENSMFMISGFWGPLGTLICGLATLLFWKDIINSKIILGKYSFGKRDFGNLNRLTLAFAFIFTFTLTFYIHIYILFIYLHLYLHLHSYLYFYFIFIYTFTFTFKFAFTFTFHPSTYRLPTLHLTNLPKRRNAINILHCPNLLFRKYSVIFIQSKPCAFEPSRLLLPGVFFHFVVESYSLLRLIIVVVVDSLLEHPVKQISLVLLKKFIWSR